MWWICVADISRALWVPRRRLLWQQVRRRDLSGSGGWRVYVMNIQIGERPSSSRTTFSYICNTLLQVTRLQMSGYSVASYLVQ